MMMIMMLAMIDDGDDDDDYDDDGGDDDVDDDYDVGGAKGNDPISVCNRLGLHSIPHQCPLFRG